MPTRLQATHWLEKPLPAFLGTAKPKALQDAIGILVQLSQHAQAPLACAVMAGTDRPLEALQPLAVRRQQIAPS